MSLIHSNFSSLEDMKYRILLKSYIRGGDIDRLKNSALNRVRWGKRIIDPEGDYFDAMVCDQYGDLHKQVRLQIADQPFITKYPNNEYITCGRNGRIEVRIVGIPKPEVTWYKDWAPLAENSRIKFYNYYPDTFVLAIKDATPNDAGMYSVSARNIAGSVRASAMVHIIDDNEQLVFTTRPRYPYILSKEEPYKKFYQIGEELGRGTQGITHHAIEKSTGRTFAAKIMHVENEIYRFMLRELEIMNHLCHCNLIRLHDSFSTDRSLVLISELAAGGELVKDNLLRRVYYTEREIAVYIHQILEGLDYMHGQGIAHMGLNIKDLLIGHVGSDDIKICDFGLARRIDHLYMQPLEYGVPEFVAPEVANHEPVSYPQDMWSVGIITFILLGGTNPFRGYSDRDTLIKIKNGHYIFEDSIWLQISDDAKDFIKKLLIYDQRFRMDVKEALKHRWFNIIDRKYEHFPAITTIRLRDYFNLHRHWYTNSSCRYFFRRKPLQKAFSNASRMMYSSCDDF